MFHRAELKQKAKEVLANSYWMCFAACAIIFVISGVASGIFGSFNIYTGLMGETAYISPVATILIGVISIMFALMSVAVSIFLLMPLQVGLNRFFVRNAETGETKLEHLFFVFKSNYLNVVKVTFMKMLFIFLWGLIAIGVVILLAIIGGALFAGMDMVSYGYTRGGVSYAYTYRGGRDFLESVLMVADILFAIVAYIAALLPALVKSYEYYMVEYILCETPDTDWRDALAQSKEMMKGNKWATFVLELSFLGWFLLGFLVCCIGSLFVQPYYSATFAQLYLKLRNRPKTADTIILGSGDIQ